MRRSVPFLLAAATALTLAACGGSAGPVASDRGPASRAGAGGSAGLTGKTDPGKRGGAIQPGTAGAGTATGGGDSTATTSGAPRKPTGLTPLPGEYAYQQSGSFEGPKGNHTYAPEGTLTVERATKVAGGERQVHVRRRSDGEGRRVTYLFLKDRVVLERFVASSLDCTVQPPMKVLPLPLRVGATWHSESACKDISLTITLEGEVLRTERRAVGGIDIDTIVVKTTLVTTYGGTFTETDTSTIWLSPEYRLAIRTEEKGASSFGTKSDFLEQLESLEPKG